MSKLFSQFGSTAVALPTDYLLINSGNPPTTKKIQLTSLQQFFAGTAFQVNNTAPNNPTGIGYMIISGSPLAVAITNIDVAIVPKGNGSLLAGIPDNLTPGGNKRGTFNVDWQLSRALASQVAGGTFGVIAGGQNNEIGTSSSNNAVIGGGQGNKITSGFYNTIAGGQSNAIVNNSDNSIGGGVGNVITTGTDNTIGGGLTNLIPSANACTIAGGQENTAGATGLASYGFIAGGFRASLRGVVGAYARASGRRATIGDSQEGGYIFRQTTTNATPTRAFTDGTGAFSFNSPTLPDNSAYSFSISCVLRDTATGNSGRLKVEGVIKRGAGAATIAIAGTNVSAAYIGDAALNTAVMTVTADTTNGCINVSFTGIAATNINWVAVMRTEETA